MYGYGYRYNSGLVVSAGGGAPFSNTKSLQFDAMDDYVDVGVLAMLSSVTAYSSSAWVKTSSFATQSAVWGRYVANDYHFFGIQASGKILFAMTAGTPNRQIDTVAAIPLNTWVNIISVYDGTLVDVDRMKIYINGVLQAVTGINPAQASTKPNTTQSVSIGGWNGLSQKMRGNIDEIAFYDYALTPADALTIGGNVPTDLSLLPTPPINWYRMGDNGSWKSPQWLIPNNENKDKVSNYSMYFDGLDDSINIGNISSLQSTSNFSISFWMKRDITTLSARNVMGFWVSGTNVIQFYQGTTVVRFRVDGGYVNNTTSIVQPNWNHFTLVYDGSLTGNVNRAKIYFNGVDETVNEAGTVPAVTNVGGPDFEIGTVGGIVTTHANANLDEVAFFDYSLTPTEVLSIYNGGGTATSGDLTSLSPTNYYKMGEEATFVYGANPDGTWTIPDEVGTNDGTSNNVMADSARVGEAPNSTNNAVSFNMDEVDRVNDTP